MWWCDGYCGTDSGCNFFAFMKLDLKSRMLPKGYLVNRMATSRGGETPAISTAGVRS